MQFVSGIAGNQLWFDRVDGSGNISSTGNNRRITVMGIDELVEEFGVSREQVQAVLQFVAASAEALAPLRP